MLQIDSPLDGRATSEDGYSLIFDQALLTWLHLCVGFSSGRSFYRVTFMGADQPIRCSESVVLFLWNKEKRGS